MLATVRSSTIVGIDPLDVDVEVDVSPGLPTFEIVGLPGTAIREARDRVRTALRNAELPIPPGRVTVNLAPAHVPKSGTLFDLPMALGVLIAGGLIKPKVNLDEILVIGELSLDGSLRPIHGALCIAAKLRHTDRTLLLPQANLKEAQLVPEVKVLGLRSLRDLEILQSLEFDKKVHHTVSTPEITLADSTSHDLWKEIKGQGTAKRAIEIAAAGGHHLLMVGPPGAGKTLLAQGMVSLIQALHVDEAVEVSQIYSVAGLLNEDHPFIGTRPFRSPHHTVTPAGLLGGGTPPQPGEVSLAHRGFLFLDELPEFSPRVLEGLRQPLEDGQVVISRSGRTVRFPAAFSLIAAANPCPCGFLGDPVHPCVCSESTLMRYRRRLSGPILDRIDLLMKVPRPPLDDVLGSVEEGESVEVVKQRIYQATKAQRNRFGSNHYLNGKMTPKQIRLFVKLDQDGQAMIRRAANRWQLSPRAIHRVLKVARTIADLQARQHVLANDIAEALSYRFH